MKIFCNILIGIHFKKKDPFVNPNNYNYRVTRERLNEIFAKEFRFDLDKGYVVITSLKR